MRAGVGGRLSGTQRSLHNSGSQRGFLDAFRTLLEGRTVCSVLAHEERFHFGSGKSRHFRSFFSKHENSGRVRRAKWEPFFHPTFSVEDTLRI